MKNILITGSTRGLGLNHVYYLSNQGFNIALVDLSDTACNVYGEVSSLKELLDSLNSSGGDNRFYKCDLTDFSATEKVFKKIFKDFGEIHGCVFNAGGDVAGSSKKLMARSLKIIILIFLLKITKLLWIGII